MAKFVGESGLAYLWQRIKEWVASYSYIESPSGKKKVHAGNSSVDIYDWAQSSTKPSYNFDEISDGTTNKAYTATEKTKLSGIATGAEVNQNAFSNVKVGSTTVAADTKTDTLELVAGSNITLTPDATNDKVTIAAADGAAAATETPLMDGTGAVGTSTKYAREDHVHPSDTTRISVDAIGAANGVCPLNSSSKIDTTYLPGFVDDVIEAYARSGQTALSSTWLATDAAGTQVITPESGKIYVLMADVMDGSTVVYAANSEFRWGGTTYVQLNDGGLSELTTSEMDSITNNWT